MKNNTRNRAFLKVGRIVLCLIFAFWAGCLPVFPELLPFKSFSAADGLATSIIHHVFRDSQGFMWFSGRGGLSRFDGSEFVSYRFSETESSPLVHIFLESRDGKYFWIASDSGLYRADRHVDSIVRPETQNLRPGQRRLRAKKVSAQGFWALHETPDGELLAGSSGGLFLVENPQADEVSFRKIEYGNTAEAKKNTSVREFVDAPDGSLWIVTDAGLVRRTPDNRFLTYEVPYVIERGNEALSIRIDAAGRIWTVFRTGVFVLLPEPLETVSGMPNLTARLLPIEEFTLGGRGEIALPERPGAMIKLKFETVQSRAGQAVTATVQDTFQSSDGKIWIPSADGLFIFNGNKYERLRDTNALPGTSRRIAEDSFGNIWFGTFSGLIKYTRGGLTTYNSTSGLPDANIYSIQETPAGELFVSHGIWRVSRLTGDGFQTENLNLPATARLSWTAVPVVQDSAGAVWALETYGLWRFDGQADLKALAAGTPQKIVNEANPAPRENTLRAYYRAFNDKKGNIWFSVYGNADESWDLVRFDPRANEWKSFSGAAGFPKKQRFAALAEDENGNAWFGFYGSRGILKFSDGRFTEIEAVRDLISGSVLAMHFDRRGRLWIATTERGLLRVENPAAENWEIVRYTEKDGLTSDNIRCLTEDLNGDIYAGTVRGVSRLDPETGQISPITTADGLAADFVQAAFRDSRGTLWFGTSNGLSRYEPVAKTKPAAPPIFISDLTIAGVDYAVSEFGQSRIGDIDLESSQNNLQINFFSVGEAGAIRYQFKLEGAETTDWVAPTEQRTVNFANLPPGGYRFLVRAVASTGATSENPAIVTFAIRPPFWKTWWFLLLSAVLVCIVLFFIYRVRTENLRRVNAALTEAKRAEEELSRARQERLQELERVRTRIATDLHDDIGSSLTQIAVLSEVARNQAAAFESEMLSHPLERIKGVSRELVEAMSDVVWAINPQKDNLGDLVQRMRRFGSDICTGRNIHFELNAPPAAPSLQLGANIRREVFAIFKEAVNNAVKYSEAKFVVADFRVEHDSLVLQISDDGRGFDMETILSDDFAPESGGNGLINMRRRARELGGACRIISFPAGGATVLLETPLHAPENLPFAPAQIGGDDSNGSSL